VPGIFLGGKEQPERVVDNLTTIYELILYRKCGSLDVSQLYYSPWLFTGKVLLFLRE
jgi:hypothetical protein